MVKTCSNCNVDKPKSEFHRNKRKKDGLDIYCKPCANEKKRTSHFNHRDKALERMKQYRLADEEAYYEKHKKYNDRWLEVNSDKMKEYHRQYSQDNKEKKNETTKRWYEADPTRRENIQKRYRQNNSDKVLARIAERRASKLQAIPAWFEREEVNKLYEQRKTISVETGVEHHVDHIIPLKGETVCGLHCLDNLQIITSVENLKKSNHLT